MSVSAVIVTRGDVDLGPIIESLPQEWEKIVWNNGGGRAWAETHTICREDLAVYGRYAAIQHASHDLIFTQDDDVIVSDPDIIAMALRHHPGGHEQVVCNMPANFRHSFYEEHSLVGFGSAFHRDAPERAFARFRAVHPEPEKTVGPEDFWHRTCDIVFTALTPRVLVDVPYEDLPWASAENRMWKQPTHREERGRMLELVRQVRDAA